MDKSDLVDSAVQCSAVLVSLTSNLGKGKGRDVYFKDNQKRILSTAKCSQEHTQECLFLVLLCFLQ